MGLDRAGPVLLAAQRVPDQPGSRYLTGADTLRDYWSGHGHAGPSHGAERDAIAWGTPGDFDRCVAQVTVHGKMTPDQAKGYCNLRHHDALGIWPAQHAKEERGKSVVGTTKASR